MWSYHLLELYNHNIIYYTVSSTTIVGNIVVGERHFPQSLYYYRITNTLDMIV